MALLYRQCKFGMKKRIPKFGLIYFLMFTYNTLESAIGAIISTKYTWFNATKNYNYVIILFIFYLICYQAPRGCLNSDL